jgi:DNA topoisomerase VI subunit B
MTEKECQIHRNFSVFDFFYFILIAIYRSIYKIIYKNLQECFETSKSRNEDNVTTGRFGVGLSTCLLYSWLQTKLPMRLTTGCNSLEGLKVFQYALDQYCKPLIIQSKLFGNENIVTGTNIKIYLPADSATIDSAPKSTHYL